MKYQLIRAEKAQLAKLDTPKLKAKIDKCCREAYRRATESPDPIVRAEAVKAIEEYMEEQFAMFASRGQDKNRAYKEAIVATGQFFTNARGENVEMYRIVPRGFTMEPMEAMKSESERSANASQSYSQMVHMGREMRRGKYNDGHRLFDVAAISVDPSEVKPFAMPSIYASDFV